MSADFTESDLEAYLDEALPAEQMARVETAIRGNSELIRRLAAVNSRRDAGSHSLGEIWRRQRLSCPGRGQLGSYLLGALEPREMQYVRFHLDVVGCRYCQANCVDLASQQAESSEMVSSRRRKYFQSSAGYLRK